MLVAYSLTIEDSVVGEGNIHNGTITNDFNLTLFLTMRWKIRSFNFYRIEYAKSLLNTR